jgi:Flp pilus assembly protein TadG
MIRASRSPSVRRGAVAVLIAIMMIPLLCLLALGIDAGWIALTKTELQNAADAAALAGAEQLMNGYVLYNLPNQANQAGVLSTAKAGAIAKAKQVASANGAGAVKSLVLNDVDVEFGFTDAQNNYSTLDQHGGYPNTVKVVLRRDNTVNTPLTLFFGRIVGMNSTTVTAMAAATTFAGRITAFDPGAGLNGLLLPVAFDNNAFNQYLVNGRSPDGTIHAGPNGAPQIDVYPSPTNAPGNFGLVQIGTPTNSASDYSTWVSQGPSSSDIAYLKNNGLLPVSLTAPQWWDGSPGLKSSLSGAFSDLAAAGKHKLIPLFAPASTSPYQGPKGQGSNSYYDIVGFAGVTITEGGGNGGNLNVSVQPCAVIDPTAVYDPSSIAPTGTTSQVMTTMVAPRLTQ